MIEMSIVSGPSGSLPWATVEAVARRLSLASPSTADLETLAELIAEASEDAEKLCGHPVARAAVVERVPGRGTRILRLHRRPVESIASITLRGQVVDPALYRIGEARTGIVVRTDPVSPNWQLTSELGGHAERFPLGGDLRHDYEVTYVGGYAMPGDDTPPDGSIPLPDALRSKVVEAVRSMWFQRATDPTVTSRTVLASTPDHGALTMGYRSKGEAEPFSPATKEFLRWYFR